MILSIIGFCGCGVVFCRRLDATLCAIGVFVLFVDVFVSSVMIISLVDSRVLLNNDFPSSLQGRRESR